MSHLLHGAVTVFLQLWQPDVASHALYDPWEFLACMIDSRGPLAGARERPCLNYVNVLSRYPQQSLYLRLHSLRIVTGC